MDRRKAAKLAVNERPLSRNVKAPDFNRHVGGTRRTTASGGSGRSRPEPVAGICQPKRLFQTTAVIRVKSDPQDASADKAVMWAPTSACRKRTFIQAASMGL